MIESGKFSVKKWKRTDGIGNRRNTGWKETVKWLTEAAADLVFPKRCVLCDEIIPFDRRKEGICDRCRSKIRYIREPFCMGCGRQLGKDQEEYCKDCSSREHVFLQNVTLYDYVVLPIHCSGSSTEGGVNMQGSMERNCTGDTGSG